MLFFCFGLIFLVLLFSTVFVDDFGLTLSDFVLLDLLKVDNFIAETSFAKGFYIACFLPIDL